MDALTDALWPEWNRRILKGLIKSPPKGSVYAIECESDDEDDDNVDETTMMHANVVSRNKVTARTVCIVCGGLGHASNVDGMACLTTQLNNRVSKDELRQIKYPNGITFPDFDRRNGKSTRYVRSSAREVVDESPPVEAQRLWVCGGPCFVPVPAPSFRFVIYRSFLNCLKRLSIVSTCS